MTGRLALRPMLRTAATGVVAAALVASIGMAAPPALAAAAPVPPVAFSTPPEAPARYVGQVACDPVERPGTVALRELLRSTYGIGNTGGITRSCSTGGTSEHKDGRAYDWMLRADHPAEKAVADDFLAWLVGKDAEGVQGGNAHRLGVMYVIWNKRTWQAWTGQWKDYTGASPHTDHVHISLSWDGAMKRTSWWTGKAVTQPDFGPCAVFIGEPAPPYTKPNYSPCPSPVPRTGALVSGDWDGDGQSTVASFVNGWFTSEVAGRRVSFSFGRSGDVPVVGDWDGDGRDGVGVVRGATWYLRNELASGAADATFRYGVVGDVPFTGSWSGDGQGIGVKRGSWWFLRDQPSGGAATDTFWWARSTDVPLSGDWSGAGADSVGVRRGQQWFLAPSVTTREPTTTFLFGRSTDLPVVGDWDGDGVVTSGVVRTGVVYSRDDHLGGAATRTVRLPV